MSEERVLTTDLLLQICQADGISIGGAEVDGGWSYYPYYMNGTEERTELRRVGTWCSPEKDDEVTVYAVATSSNAPQDDCAFVESWVVRWVEDMGDWGTNYTSYVLPYQSLKKFFHRWVKEQTE